MEWSVNQYDAYIFPQINIYTECPIMKSIMVKKHYQRANELTQSRTLKFDKKNLTQGRLYKVLRYKASCIHHNAIILTPSKWYSKLIALWIFIISCIDKDSKGNNPHSPYPSLLSSVWIVVIANALELCLSCTNPSLEIEHFNSSRLSDAYRHQWTMPSWFQILAYYLFGVTPLSNP